MARPGQIRLSEAIDQYLQTRRGHLADVTVREDSHTLKRLLKMTGNIQVQHVTHEHVQGFFANLLVDHHDSRGNLRKGIAPSSFNTTRQRINGFARYCQLRGMTRTDWLAFVRPIPVPRRLPAQHSIPVLWTLLDAAGDARDRALLAVGCALALRASEVRGLRVSDLDLDAGTLRVWVQKSRLEDVMVIPDFLVQEMEVWLRTYRLDLLGRGERLEPGCFLIPARRRPLYVAQGVQQNGGYDSRKPVVKPERFVQEALHRLGLPTERQGMHTLRRSVARAAFDNLVDEGYDGALRTVSALLHHSDSRVTERYLGLTTEGRKRDDFQARGGVMGTRGVPVLDNVRALR